MNLKEEILKPGTWSIGLTAFGETLPDHSNRMYLNYEKTDEWGLPTVTFDADFGPNELAMRIDMQAEAVKMGFAHAACGPLVRSSYHADKQAAGEEVK